VVQDIKPKNIFLTGKNHVRLGDLGCAKLMKTGLARTQIGTPYYMSPEIWLNKPYDSKSDMWALGCLLYELAMLVPPFLANDMNGLAVKVKTTPASRISKHYSDDLAGLVAAMLSEWCRRGCGGRCASGRGARIESAICGNASELYMALPPSAVSTFFSTCPLCPADKDARLRPDVRQVLTHPAVTARLHTVPEGDDTPWAGDDLRSAMLSTIRVPVGFGYGGGKPAGLVLPAPSYPALRRADSAPSGLSAEDESALPSAYGGAAGGGFAAGVLAAGAYDAAPASAAGGAGAPAPVAAPRAVSFARPAAPQPTSFAAATSPPQLGRYLKRTDSAGDPVGLGAGAVEKENAYAAQLRAAAAGVPPMARVPSAGALLAVPSTNAAGGVRQLVSVPSSRAMLGAGAGAAAPLSSAAAGGYGLGAGRALAPLSAAPSSRPSLIPSAGAAAAGAGGYGMGVPSSAVAAKLAALPPPSGAAAGAPIRKYVAAHQLPPSSAAGGAGIYSRPAAMAAPSAAYGAAGVAAPRYSAYGALPSAGGLGAAAAAPAAGRYLMRHL
jgi:hypothetical protein